MHNLTALQTCVQSRVQPVYWPRITVAELCTFFVQSTCSQSALRTTSRLYATLCAAYTRNYPRLFTSRNRGGFRVIPSIHSPNNKNYIDNLKEIYRKTVEKEKEAHI